MKNLLLFASALALLISCQERAELVQMTNQGPAQGSTYSISYIVEEGVDYRRDIDSVLRIMDEQMSLWVPGSEISRLNSGDSVAISSDFAKVIALSKMCSAFTGGAFDITIAPVIKAWGFSGGKHNSDVNVDSLMNYVGWSSLANVDSMYALPRGYQIDVNAIAQGYTVDVVARMLESKGVEDYMVEIGGEVRCKGANIQGRKWRIGIEQPVEERTEGMYQAIVELDTMALATSGNYRKFWVDERGQKVVHTIDPETGMPVVSNLLSVSVIAANAASADAFATASMVKGLAGAERMIEGFVDVEAFFIYSNNFGELEIKKTSGWSKYEVN